LGQSESRREVKAIHIYANQYKLTDIGAEGFRIDDSSFEARVPYLFSAQELADPWVRLRPNMASAFTYDFSTRHRSASSTPSRYRTRRLGPEQVVPVLGASRQHLRRAALA